MQISPVTHPGHTTTYNYELVGDDGEVIKINAADPGHVRLRRGDGPWCYFSTLKSAINSALGAPD